MNALPSFSILFSLANASSSGRKGSRAFSMQQLASIRYPVTYTDALAAARLDKPEGE